MRRFRRRRETLAVSLFPFLAVLICTFGVLVILLVLAVKAADESAQKTKQMDEQNFQEHARQWSDQLDFERTRSEGLAQVRPELVERLQSVRDTRTHLENEIAKLNEEATLVARQLVRQDHTQVETDLESIRKEIEEVESRLAESLAELDVKVAQAVDNQPVMYSIVPHGGAGGESRMPVYIECRQDKLILQPYRIEMELKDFASPVHEQNPLDAALLTVREYFLRYDLEAVRGKPYPLLVVRPDGAESYVLARHAIRGWDDEFGYELISADKPLAYGDADPQLSEAIRKAVAISMQQQQRLMAHRIAVQTASHHQRTMAPTGGMRASRQLGGFVSETSDSLAGSKRSSDRGARGRGEALAEGSRSFRDTRQSQNNGPNQGVGQDGTERQQNGTASPTSLARQRGENWALPSRTPGAVGYRRPIRVFCSNDEISIMGAGPSADRVSIAWDEDRVFSVDSMIDAIWKMIESWGVTGANGYWVPELRFTVAEGAEERMEQLLSLLEGSGLAVEGVEK